MNLRILFWELEKCLERINSPILGYWQPGIERKQIQNEMVDCKVPLSDDVYELYEWKNGTNDEIAYSKTLGDLQFFTLGIFPSFQKIYKDHIDYSTAGFWDKDMFPLFESGGGDYFLIDCRKGSETHGMIHFFAPSFYAGTVTKYDSLEALFATIIECYRSGVYFLDTDGQLDCNPKLEFEISHRMNPLSSYWTMT